MLTPPNAEFQVLWQYKLDLLRIGDPNVQDNDPQNTGDCGVALLGVEIRSPKWTMRTEEEWLDCRLCHRCTLVLEIGETVNHGACSPIWM